MFFCLSLAFLYNFISFFLLSLESSIDVFTFFDLVSQFPNGSQVVVSVISGSFSVNFVVHILNGSHVVVSVLICLIISISFLLSLYFFLFSISIIFSFSLNSPNLLVLLSFFKLFLLIFSFLFTISSLMHSISISKVS